MHQNTIDFLQKRIEILEREVASCNESVQEHLNSIETIKKSAAEVQTTIGDLRNLIALSQERELSWERLEKDVIKRWAPNLQSKGSPK